MKDHATILSGRYMAGKTVAVEEVLQGTRGAFRFCIKYADWESLMYQVLEVKDANMFKQVLRRVRKRLAKLTENPTKFPILLRDIPPETNRQVISFFQTHKLREHFIQSKFPWGAMSLVSTTAKDLQAMQPMIFQFMSRPLLSKFEVGRSPYRRNIRPKNPPIPKVMVSCSSAASELAFDAGSVARQKDICGLRLDRRRSETGGGASRARGRMGQHQSHRGKMHLSSTRAKLDFLVLFVVGACFSEFRRPPRRGCGESLWYAEASCSIELVLQCWGLLGSRICFQFCLVVAVLLFF